MLGDAFCLLSFTEQSRQNFESNPIPMTDYERKMKVKPQTNEQIHKRTAVLNLTDL